MRLRRDRVAALVSAAALVAQCSCFFHRTSGYRIEVRSGSNREQKVTLAHSVIAPEKLSVLRAKLKLRIAGLTDAEVQGISYGVEVWELSSHPKPGDDARVYVSIRALHERGFDPEPIVLAAAQLLEAELESLRPQ